MASHNLTQDEHDAIAALCDNVLRIHALPYNADELRKMDTSKLGELLAEADNNTRGRQIRVRALLKDHKAIKAERDKAADPAFHQSILRETENKIYSGASSYYRELNMATFLRALLKERQDAAAGAASPLAVGSAHRNIVATVVRGPMRTYEIVFYAIEVIMMILCTGILLFNSYDEFMYYYNK